MGSEMCIRDRSTHVLQEVEMLCSRVILIDEGQLVFDDDISAMGNRDSMAKRFHELTKFAV